MTNKSQIHPKRSTFVQLRAYFRGEFATRPKNSSRKRGTDFGRFRLFNIYLIVSRHFVLQEIHVVVRPADPMDKNKQQQQQQNSAAHSQPKLASFYNPSMAATNHYPNVKTEYSPGSPSYDGYSQIASTGNGLNCSYNGAAGGVGQMNKSPHYSNQAPHYLNQAPMSPPGISH